MVDDMNSFKANLGCTTFTSIELAVGSNADEGGTRPSSFFEPLLQSFIQEFCKPEEKRLWWLLDYFSPSLR